MRFVSRDWQLEIPGVLIISHLRFVIGRNCLISRESQSKIDRCHKTPWTQNGRTAVYSKAQAQRSPLNIAKKYDKEI